MIAAEPPTYVTSPAWERKPSGEDFARLYPNAAEKKGVNGYGVIECTVTGSGELSLCEVLGEEPVGQGFGASSLQMGPLFKMKTLMTDGRSAVGGRVRIPLRWRLPGSAAPQTPSLAGTTACYGQVVAMTERNPGEAGAWRANLFWTVQFQGFFALQYAHPSEVEARAREARVAAAAGTLEVPKGWELAACLDKVPKAPEPAPHK